MVVITGVFLVRTSLPEQLLFNIRAECHLVELVKVEALVVFGVISMVSQVINILE